MRAMLTPEQKQHFTHLFGKKDLAKLTRQFQGIKSRCKGTKIWYQDVECKFESLEQFLYWVVEASSTGMRQVDENYQSFHVARFADTGNYHVDNCEYVSQAKNKQDQAFKYQVVDTHTGKRITSHKGLVTILQDEFNFTTATTNAHQYANTDKLYKKRFKIMKLK